MKSKDDIFKEMISAGPGPGQRRWAAMFAALAVIGTVAFLYGVSGPLWQRAWMAYLVNFLFWSSISFGAVLVSAALNMSNGKWGRPAKRLAEAPGAFLPVAFILFWVLYFGKDAVFPWIHEPVPDKAGWLNAPFVFARDGLSFLLLTAVSSALLYCSVKADLKAVSLGAPAWPPRDAGKNPFFRAQITLSTVYGILYAVLLTLVGFDLVMSLSPEWKSTLFGAYYFIGAFYMGIASTILLSSIAVRNMGLADFIREQQFHDLGKLLLAFCLVTADFFYSQFLVIWFGNLPEETRYVLTRFRQTPWNALSWTVLTVCFVIPFLVLLRRNLKKKPVPMMALSIFILAGMWLERFLLVAPSLWHEPTLPIGWMEVLITAGFFGIAALCVLAFLRKFPLLPISDPLFINSFTSAMAISVAAEGLDSGPLDEFGKIRKAAQGAGKE